MSSGFAFGLTILTTASLSRSTPLIAFANICPFAYCSNEASRSAEMFGILDIKIDPNAFRWPIITKKVNKRQFFVHFDRQFSEVDQLDFLIIFSNLFLENIGMQAVFNERRTGKTFARRALASPVDINFFRTLARLHPVVAVTTTRLRTLKSMGTLGLQVNQPAGGCHGVNETIKFFHHGGNASLCLMAHYTTKNRLRQPFKYWLSLKCCVRYNQYSE